MFELIDSKKKELGFNSVICSTINEIISALKEYKPDLLIFDCHGDFDEKTLSSYLIIDAENKITLTGEEIMENKFSAPLVFLSACNTMPNYGYVKFLSDAFMQAGAFSVTTTFLPLLITDAAILIVRFLGMLNHQKDNAIHSNWLEFISHVLRTTMIHEAIKKATLKNKDLRAKIPNTEIATILADTMILTGEGNHYCD
ncbi:MAG: CHAT domain-containing protein [Saprospiraceae bacterium]|nr:CHAT domain-containing protein [Saprospiraceae bacterium]